MARFDDRVRSLGESKLVPVLDAFEGVTAGLTAKANIEVRWDPPTNDPRRLLNHHIDAVWGSHASKFSILAENIITSVNEGDFLVYGLLGRSLIEHTAVLRYYLKKEANPIVERCVKSGMTTGKDLEQLIDILDRLHRAGQFDWSAFFAGEFEKLAKRASLREPLQVRVGDCMKDWSQDDEHMGTLYGLFCDLVHPNVGTNLLVIKQWPEAIGFGGHRGRPFGSDIFLVTIAGLTAVVSTATELLQALHLMKVPEGPQK